MKKTMWGQRLPALLLALVLCTALSPGTRLTYRRFLDVLEGTAKGMIMVIPLCAAIGILVGAMTVTGAVVDLPILRPVVGMDKEDIVKIARKIGTFEISILPYEDCCTVFTPRHPRLRPTLEELEAAEQALDIEGMIQAAVDGIERIQV